MFHVRSAVLTPQYVNLCNQQIIETVKWHNSVEINLYLQIAMTIVVWILVFPTTFVAYKLFKDFGWYVYRRIGPELRLQSKRL